MTLLSTVRTISGLPKDTRPEALVKRHIYKCPELKECEDDGDCDSGYKCCPLGEFPGKTCLQPGNVFKYFQPIHHNQQPVIRALDRT